MTTTYSEAPWRLEDEIYDSYREIYDDFGEVVAKVAAWDGDNDKTVMAGAKANAYLIAAAPELLEALKYQEMADADPAASRRKGYYEEAARSRKAAIAKAEGNSNALARFIESADLPQE